MIYPEEKSSDLTAPLAILLAIAGLLAALFATSGRKEYRRQRWGSTNSIAGAGR